MAWIILIVAGLCETFAVAMISQYAVKKNKRTIILIIVGLTLALALLSYALQTIAMGTGYAVWTGISVVGSSFVGMFYFGESKDWKRIVCIMIILSTSIGLKLIS